MQIFYFARIDGSVEDANSSHVFEFCRHFSRLGHSVTLFLPDLGKQSVLENVPIVYVPVFVRKPAFTFFSFYFALFFYFLFYYFKLRPDVVYTRHQQMEWMVTWLRYVLRFIYVIEVNGLSTVELKINSKPEWIIRATRCLEWFEFRLPHTIVTSSRRICEVLCENYQLDPSSFFITTNGTDPDIFHPMDTRQCRLKLGLDLEGKYLIFVGSFKKWHGIGEIVSLVPQLLEKIPNLRLLLVGDGEGKLAIEQFILRTGLDKHVICFGRKNSKEIPAYINSADICLAPYFEEAINETGISPLKIFEYMACGKPVISNAVSDMRPFFQSAKMGLLVESMNPLDWVDPIESLLNDPERMREFGNNGRQAVINKYNWRAICQDIAQHISKL